ncbi:MAG TPA: hypothetical protein VG755_44475 [Nannocystaceae bacterium]|nr:hypothetical protein [Nannocystaceae bacterium]
MNRKALGIFAWCSLVACGPELATGTGASGGGGGDEGDSGSADATAESGGGAGEPATCWEWVPDGPAFIDAIAPLPDGSVVVVGLWDDGPAIAKLDAHGELVWSTSRPIAEAHYTDVVVLASGDLVALGMSVVDYGSSRALLHGYTADGVQTWAASGAPLDDQWFHQGARLGASDRVLVGGDAGTFVFDGKGALVETIDPDTTNVYSVAPLADGVASCGMRRAPTLGAWKVTAFDVGVEPVWSFMDEPMNPLVGCEIAAREPDEVAMMIGDAREEGDTLVRSIRGAEIAWEWSLGTLAFPGGVAIADDGTTYAVGSFDDEMWLRSFSSTGDDALLRAREGTATALAWAPGRLFYAGAIFDDTMPAFVGCVDLTE